MTNSEIIIYQDASGRNRIDVKLSGETVWLTQAQMADLFGIDKSGISRHIKDIFKSGELVEDTTVANFATVINRGF